MPYPFFFAKVSDVVEEVDKVLKQRITEPSKFPYCYPLLLVKKPDGTYRLVVDFRQLNRDIAFDSEPMPNPEAIFALRPKSKTRKVQRHSEEDAAATVSSKLDCFYGYWQIAMHAKDKEKNAFSRPPDFRAIPISTDAIWMSQHRQQVGYAIVERECLTIVWALEKFTTYLYGRTFVIQTDHQPVAFLRTTPN